MAVSENPCILRSTSSLDDLANVDYLFMLDGSVATDGILHFESLYTADGETRNLERLGQSATALCEMIALYSRARSSAPSIGTIVNNEIEIGIGEFMSRSAIDAEALKIRCTIHSYLSGIDRRSRDVISYSDRGVKSEINVSFDVAILNECSTIMLSGDEKPISRDGFLKLTQSFENYVSMGRRPVIFTRGVEGQRCFVGMLILHEHTDASLSKAISSLRKSGINVIAFSNCNGRAKAPEVPDILRHGNRAYADEFARQGRDITFSFGDYDEYCGFGEKDIAKLAKYVKKNKKGLAICAFTDYASEAINCADVFVTCAPVRTGVFGRFAEEIRSLEVPGEQSSASCTQTVKARADVLLMRPKENKGGLEPLAIAAFYCRVAYRNLYRFIRYFIFAQIMRLVAIAFPMLFGQTVADARHVLLLALIFDIGTMMIFAADMRRSRLPRRPESSELMKYGVKELVIKDKALLFSSLIGGILILLLPNLVSLISFFDNYIYKEEFTFVAHAFLHLCLWWSVYSDDVMDVMALKKLFKNRLFDIMLAASFVFILICFLTPV